MLLCFLAKLGLLYMKKENYKSAKGYMVTVISHDQNDISYIYNLSVVLDKLSDFKIAATFYLRLQI